MKDSGQATVEFALVLPLVMLIFAVGIHLVAYSRNQVLVVNSARAAARVAMTTGSADAIYKAGREASPGLAPDRLSFEIEGERRLGGLVRVRAKYRYEVRIPIFDEFWRDKTVISADVAMPVEIP